MASKKKADEITPPTDPLELPDTGVATMGEHEETLHAPVVSANQEGLDLLPNMEETGVIEATRWYWCGTFPTISRAEISIAGVSFVRTHEIVSDRGASGVSKRTPYIGQCMCLTKVQVDAIRERLRYSVYRFTEEPREIFAEGEGIEALEQKARRGVPIRIMTEKENKARIDGGLSKRGYSPEPLDEAMAYHLFIVPCSNQDRPRGGVEYPPNVVTTGLQWIGE